MNTFLNGGSHHDCLTTSHDHLIGYSHCTHAIFDVIGWGRGVKHDVHMIMS